VQTAVLDTPTPAAPPETDVPLWRNWRFQVLWVGSSVSFLGLNAADFAYPVVILAITKSPALAGLFGFIQLTASVLTGIPAGSPVDRFDRRHVLIAVEAIRAMVTASVAIAWGLGHLTIAHLFLVAAALGAASPLAAARTLVVRSVVPPAQLTQALTQDEVRTAAGGLAGPPLGGALLAVSRGLPFLMSALTFAIGLLSALIVRIPPRDTSGEAGPAKAGEPASKSDGALAGIREIWHSPMIRAAVAMISVVNIGGEALFLAIVVLLSHQGASTRAIGLAVTGAAVGNLLGAGLVGRLHRRIPPGVLLVLVSSMFVVILPLLAVPLGPWWVFGVLTVSMLGVPAVRVLIDVLILRQVPDAHRGRTITALMTLMTIGVPFGTLAGGLSLQLLGAPATILAICGVTAIAVGIGLANKALRTAAWPAA
jgi:predicted MFS family arabinose efflux permease